MLPGQSPDAAAGHVEEGGGGSSGLQGGFNAPQQVVGLEQQQHLPRNLVQQLADLGQVERCVASDLMILHRDRGKVTGL